MSDYSTVRDACRRVADFVRVFEDGATACDALVNMEGYKGELEAAVKALEGKKVDLGRQTSQIEADIQEFQGRRQKELDAIHDDFLIKEKALHAEFAAKAETVHADFDRLVQTVDGLSKKQETLSSSVAELTTQKTSLALEVHDLNQAKQELTAAAAPQNG